MSMGRGNIQPSDIVSQLMKTDSEKHLNTGLDAGKISAAINLFEQGYAQGLYTAGALWVSHKGKSATSHCLGYLDNGKSVPVDERTLFDLASLTKPIVTATSVLLLISEGKLGLDQPVAVFFPETKSAPLGSITISQLLTHTSGLPAWRDLYGEYGGRDRAIQLLLDTPLTLEPGSHYEYSCLGYILLGLIIEIVSGQKLDEFSRERIFEPMGMDNTSFGPVDRSRTASTGWCERRGRQLTGEVHDLNSFVFQGVSGNAGLFSSLHDMATFCHTITDIGQSMVVLAPIQADWNNIFANALSENLGGHSLSGWFVWPNDMLPCKTMFKNGVAGHTGFTGTAILFDMLSEMCSVMLTNRVCNAGDGVEFRALRREIFDTVLSAVVG